jgi:hypothetical protein
MILEDIISEVFLTEAVALTKGSQRVMNDKNLVTALAARVRRDADFNPSVFPKGADLKFEKAPDEDVAKWFLENIDKIEREGYEGTIYSRDGLYSDWIARRYIAGSHTWEDLIGVMNMNLRDWTILKNRGELDDAHKEVSKFKSVRDIGSYMVHHYQDKLADARNAAQFAARDKMARAIPLVNNESYKITVALNRAAACKLGNGTQWCTANSADGTNYNNYSQQAMLYQMFPNAAETVNKKGINGKIITGKEKYQFGPDRYLSFKDIADEDVNKEEMRTKFPYLYNDLVTALKQNKPKIEELSKTFAEDPLLQDPEMSKVNHYDVDEEILKLKKFVEKGYMTDKVRPKEKVEKDDTGQEQPKLSLPVEPLQQQGQAPMESIAEFAKRMIEGKDIELEEEDLETESDMDGGDLESMGAGTGPTGGGKYPPGTAPTMPESINNKGTEIMENVDKDVEAMLTSLKKYDKLNESVLGMVTLGKAGTKIKEEGNPWENLGKEDKEKDLKDGESKKSSTGGTTTKTKTGLVHKQKSEDVKEADEVDEKVDEEDKDKVEESADPAVLDWMSRFAKLGNMKGYGR